jgi:hypothetical protein
VGKLQIGLGRAQKTHSFHFPHYRFLPFVDDDDFVLCGRVQKPLTVLCVSHAARDFPRALVLRARDSLEGETC